MDSNDNNQQNEINEINEINESHEYFWTIVCNFLRVPGVLFIIFIYISFVLYLDYRNGFEKILGFTTLAAGLIVLTPIKSTGIKSWLIIYTCFSSCGVLLLVLI